MLAVPAGRATRPARARLRRTVFDILQQRVLDVSWLDLYAGSGSFGIEALSRGARQVSFVEAGREGHACLLQNLKKLGLARPEAEVLRRRLPELLHNSPPQFAPFDFVTLDPPFAISRQAQDLDRLLTGLVAAGEKGWWAAGCELIWEEPSDAPAPTPTGFEQIDQRPFGSSRLRILRFLGEPAGKDCLI